MKGISRNALLKICSSFIILYCILVLVSGAQSEPIRDSILITLLLSNIAIFFGGIRENPADPWNQILAIWILLGFFHPIARNNSNESYFQGQLGVSVVETMPKASIYLGIGMLFTLLGVSRGKNSLSKKPSLRNGYHLHLTPITEAILTIIWIVSTLFLLKEIGISGYLKWRSRETQVSLISVSSYLFFTNYLLIVPGILRLRRANRSRIDLMLGLAFLYSPVLINTLSGNRIFVIPILILHYYILSTQNLRINLLKVFVFFIVILISISGLRFLRESSDPHSTYRTLTFSQQQISIFEGQDLAMLDNLSLLVNSKARNPEFPLIDYLNIVTKPIPRQIWQSKPPTFDQKLNSILLPAKFQNGYGFSFTFIGESLYELGIGGIPIVGFLFGLFLGRCKKWVGSGELSRHYIAGVISISMIVIFVRGSFSADSPRLLFALFPLFLCKYRKYQM